MIEVKPKILVAQLDYTKQQPWLVYNGDMFCKNNKISTININGKPHKLDFTNHLIFTSSGYGDKFIGLNLYYAYVYSVVEARILTPSDDRIIKYVLQPDQSFSFTEQIINDLYRYEFYIDDAFMGYYTIPDFWIADGNAKRITKDDWVIREPVESDFQHPSNVQMNYNFYLETNGKWVFNVGFGAFNTANTSILFQGNILTDLTFTSKPTIEVICDGNCPPGDCEASDDKYPGYQCLPCQEFITKQREIQGIMQKIKSIIPTN